MNNTLQEKVSIENKFALTVKEAAEYFNIGEHARLCFGWAVKG